MIKVIAGEHKGRVLLSPKSEKIRPTTQKVREAAFSIIGERIYDSKFLDLFTGTGAIGIEAISRGANKVYFGDSSYKSIKILKENLSFCNSDSYKVLTGKFEKIVKHIDSFLDIVYLDPPYYMDSLESILNSINDITNSNSMIIFEHGKEQKAEEEYNKFYKIEDKRYGNMFLSIYFKR